MMSAASSDHLPDLVAEALQSAEENRKLSERRFQDIAEVSGDWMWETDQEHRFTLLFGERIEELRIRPESMIGRTRWEIAGAATDEPWVQHKADLDAHLAFRRFRYEIAAPTGATVSV